MGFSVTLYKIVKKRNSTKLPSSPINSKAYTVELKDSTSILTPTLKIKDDIVSTFIPNYCQIAKFDRYYFVNNITWVNGIWEVQLSVDVLATYKVEIGAQTLYVERSATSYNGTIVDATYPAKSDYEYEFVGDGVYDPLWEISNINNGTFVVGVVGQKTTYYTFTSSALEVFMNYLLSGLYANDLNGLWGAIYPELNYNANPLQFISSIIWLPFDYGAPSATTVKVGFIDVSTPSGVGEIDLDPTITFVVDFLDTPRHPQATRGEYLNNTPYSKYELYLPPFGIVTLNPSIVANSDYMKIAVIVDLRTGEATLEASGYPGAKQDTWITSKAGLNYQVSQVINQPGLGIGQVASIAGDILTSPAPGVSAYKGALSAIGSMARSNIQTTRSIGNTGSINTLTGIPAIMCEFKPLVDEDIGNKGRPLCERTLINTLSGYIQASDANVEIAAEEQEIEEIISYMQGGFFYE